MQKLWNKENLTMIAPIPALLLGAIIMHTNEISPLVYGQNIISYLVLGLLFLFLGAKSTFALRKNWLTIVMIGVGCLAVASTFLDRGLENVHRWLAIGNFRLYIASLVMPCIIIGLGTLLQRKIEALPITIAMLITLLMVLQPDASQASAFALSMGYLVWTQPKKPFLKSAVVVLFASAILYSWMHLDALAPVAHVECILQMAQDKGMVWFLLGIGSLTMLLVPFFAFSKVSVLANAVGLYYLVVLIATFIGNFPVPFMGFGISPIIGYQLALFLLCCGNTLKNEYV